MNGWKLVSLPPSAGDEPEIYGYQCRKSAEEKFYLSEYPYDWQHLPLIRLGDHRAAVTALSAQLAASQARENELIEDFERELNSLREISRIAEKFKASWLACDDQLAASQLRVAESVDLLGVWKTWLGDSRASCDESGKIIWDRIEALAQQVTK